MWNTFGGWSTGTLPLLPCLLWSRPRRETSTLSAQSQAYEINLLSLLFFINICLDLNSRRGLKWAIFEVKTWHRLLNIAMKYPRRKLPWNVTCLHGPFFKEMFHTNISPRCVWWQCGICRQAHLCWRLAGFKLSWPSDCWGKRKALLTLIYMNSSYLILTHRCFLLALKHKQSHNELLQVLSRPSAKPSNASESKQVKLKTHNTWRLNKITNCLNG